MADYSGECYVESVRTTKLSIDIVLLPRICADLLFLPQNFKIIFCPVKQVRKMKLANTVVEIYFSLKDSLQFMTHLHTLSKQNCFVFILQKCHVFSLLTFERNRRTSTTEQLQTLLTYLKYLEISLNCFRNKN